MTLEFLEIMEDMNKTVKPQPRIKVRGTATFIRVGDELRDFEFTGYQQGEPVQKNVRKFGNSRFYETEGRKESSYVAHLRVSRDSVDPAAELMEQLEGVMPAALKDKDSPLKPAVKMLENTGVLKIWHNRRLHKVVVQMEISTDTGRDPSDALFQLSAATNKCFAINRPSLCPRK